MSLYTTQTIASYNASAPGDDGSAVASNQVTWAGVKTKLGDPVKTLAEDINTELVSVFTQAELDYNPSLNAYCEATCTTSVGEGSTYVALDSSGSASINRGTVWNTTSSYFDVPFTGQYLIYIRLNLPNVANAATYGPLIQYDTAATFDSPATNLLQFESAYNEGTASTKFYTLLTEITLQGTWYVRFLARCTDFSTSPQDVVLTTRIMALYRS